MKALGGFLAAANLRRRLHFLFRLQRTKSRASNARKASRRGEGGRRDLNLEERVDVAGGRGAGAGWEASTAAYSTSPFLRGKREVNMERRRQRWRQAAVPAHAQLTASPRRAAWRLRAAAPRADFFSADIKKSGSGVTSPLDAGKRPLPRRVAPDFMPPSFGPIWIQTLQCHIWLNDAVDNCHSHTKDDARVCACIRTGCGGAVGKLKDGWLWTTCGVIGHGKYCGIEAECGN